MHVRNGSARLVNGHCDCVVAITFVVSRDRRTWGRAIAERFSRICEVHTVSSGRRRSWHPIRTALRVTPVRAIHGVVTTPAATTMILIMMMHAHRNSVKMQFYRCLFSSAKYRTVVSSLNFAGASRRKRENDLAT